MSTGIWIRGWNDERAGKMDTVKREI